MKQTSKLLLLFLFLTFIVAVFLMAGHLISEQDQEAIISETESLQSTESVIQQKATEMQTGSGQDTELMDTSRDTENSEDPLFDEDQEFYIKEIDTETADRITGKSYHVNPDITLGELRQLHLLYYGFDEKTHQGEMIVNQLIADKVLGIFRKLYEQKYQIEQIALVDEYDADDETSMEHDNTSAFNYRNIAGSAKLSNHSYGLAIDLNPLYNPAVWTDKSQNMVVQPSTAGAYTDRSLNFAHKIDQDDLAYQLFTEAGFTWGGNYKNSKDYQHFEYVKSK